MTDEDIKDELDRMEEKTKALKDEAIRICWYMRGSISYDDAMLLSSTDITLINKLIADNLKTTEKTGLNFF